MTWEPAGWARARGHASGGGFEPAAAPPLERAVEEVRAALRGLSQADDVGWTTPAAARYRAVLERGSHGVRAAAGTLDAALAAAHRHDVEVARASAGDQDAIAAQGLAWLLGGSG